MLSTRLSLSLAAAGLLHWGISGSAAADTSIRVVVSIKPAHSLVSAVMAGVAEPHLIMRGAVSPDTYTMRPSDAAMLEKADVAFLVDEAMEIALAAQIRTLAGNARVVELSGAAGLVRRPLREGGAFDVDHHHSHDDDGHAADDDLAAQPRGAYDLHVWLDPANAEAMVRMIARILAEADPSNAARYADNAHQHIHELEHLSEEIAAAIQPARGVPFIVFHDGNRYFEDRFGLNAAGSAVVSAERSPGVKRIRELREKVRELGVVCVFDEPHFDQRLVNTIVEATSVRAGTLDPLGVGIQPGPELYFTLLREMAGAFRECLAPASGG